MTGVSKPFIVLAADRPIPAFPDEPPCAETPRRQDSWPLSGAYGLTHCLMLYLIRTTAKLASPGLGVYE
jgi:hypothetical protein